MKKLFGVILGMTLSTAVFAATPQFGTVADGFDADAFAAIDNGIGAGQETIRVSKQNTSPTANNINSGFSWGGCTTATISANLGSLNIAGADFLQFNKEAGFTGTYAYTRFDVDNTDGNVTPSVALNCTNPGASIVLDINNVSVASGVRLAVLIRDGADWWQSSDQAIGAMGAYTFDLGTPGALTWTRIDNGPGTGGEDMDEVDAGGELPLVADADQSGAPNLGAIEGVGIIATSMAEGNLVKVQVNTLTINAPDLAGVEDWSTR